MIPHPADRQVQDSLPVSWVEHMPPGLRPYLRLARYDRPIGFWLLALPGWAGVALATIGYGVAWMDIRTALILTIGAIAMRGAGCAYNDIIDRDLDAKVARTADRPLAARTISLRAAWAFVLAQCVIGLIVLLTLPLVAQIAALAAIPLVAVYPFMKRIIWWPQAWLGLTFNWAALVGFAAIHESISLPVLVLYAGLAVWTLGYDTIYACQDSQDDALVGVKSTARLFGDSAPLWLGAFYALSAALCAFSIASVSGVSWTALMVLPFAAHLALQASRFDPHEGEENLVLFKSNRNAGLLLAGGFFAASLMLG